jgi:transcriptional regulator of NAD metabolism
MRERHKEPVEAGGVRTLGGGQGRKPDAEPAPRRGQRGEERRQELLRTLRMSGEPVLGSELAKQFGVSRQVLVQDMAILRAAGSDVIATPRGYLLRNPEPVAHRDVLHLQHDRGALGDEMTIMVDLGIRILDDVIDHPVFGALRTDLYVSSRQDVQELIERLDATDSLPLQELTGGRHSHTVESARPDLLSKARDELQRRGYLAPQ